MNCAVSCPQIRRNTVSKECHRTRDRMPSPERWITCRSVRHCTARVTCKRRWWRPSCSSLDLPRFRRCAGVQNSTYEIWWWNGTCGDAPVFIDCAMKGYFTSCLYYCFLLLLLLSLRDCGVVQETGTTNTVARGHDYVFFVWFCWNKSRNAMCRSLEQNYKLEYQSEFSPKYTQ